MSGPLLLYEQTPFLVRNRCGCLSDLPGYTQLRKLAPEDRRAAVAAAAKIFREVDCLDCWRAKREAAGEDTETRRVLVPFAVGERVDPESYARLGRALAPRGCT